MAMLAVADDEKELFDVDIWNHEGDVIRAFRDVTIDEVDDIREQYQDEPLLSVVVTPR